MIRGEAFAYVVEYFEGDLDRAYLWFETPNPQLGNVSPNDMIKLGRDEKLLKFILESRENNERRI